MKAILTLGALCLTLLSQPARASEVDQDLASGPVASEADPVIEASVQVIRDAFPEFSQEVIEDILWVARETDQDPLVIASIVKQESTGRYDVMSYCVVWAKPVWIPKTKKWNKPCTKWATCRTNCRNTPAVWKNHLDLGLWQLRDVVEKKPDGKFAGWSWLRWYRGKTQEKITSSCALNRECARKVMARAVLHLAAESERAHLLAKKEKRTPREQRVLAALSSDFRCREVPQEFRWLGGWNGCSSALNHAQVTAGLRSKRDLVVGIRYLRKVVLLWLPEIA